MSRFYARMKPHARPAVTRRGHATGINVSLDGWNGGVLVRAAVNANGEDIFHVFATKGSNGIGTSAELEYIGAVDANGAFSPTIETFERAAAQVREL